jgi:hypothetical protein
MFEKVSQYGMVHYDVDPTKLDNLMLGEVSKGGMMLSSSILFVGLAFGVYTSLRSLQDLSVLLLTFNIVRDFAMFA